MKHYPPKEQYRWDKRREKKQIGNFASRHGFDSFDIVLFILVFTLGVVLFKFFMIFAITMSACADLAANFGASAHTPPAFKLFVYISMLMLVLWFIHLIARKRPKQLSWVNAIWQTLIFMCISLFALASYHMSIWDNPRPPDGTLAAANGVWGIENGERVWKNLPLFPYPDKDNYGNTVYDPEYRLQRCVWLDTGRISVDDDPFVGDHAAFTKQALQDWKNDGYRPSFPYRHTVFPLKIDWRILYERQSWLETLRNTVEPTRPLTPEERARFVEKQKCVKVAAWDHTVANAAQRSARIERCDPTEFPVLPKEWQRPPYIYTPQP